MKILTENYLKSLEKEILTENYSDLFDKVYSDFRKEQSEFKTEIIEIGKIYYRARVGNDTMEAAIDDLNIISKIPYFGNNMDKPPARFVQGGRFNRQGVSYLYLADNVETCISEIHLQVGQICSIVQFKCIKEGKYLFIENKSEEVLYDILTRPIHNGTKDYYLMTQFFSDIFKALGYDGLVFFSTQGIGKNIVCFKKGYFEQVKYSEKMYRAKKISYEYEIVEEEYKKYIDYKKLLNPGNTDEDQKREDKYDYVQEKIQYEDSLILEEAKKLFNSDKNEKEFFDRIKEINCKQYAYEFLGAFYFNQQNLEKGIQYFFFFFSTFCSCPTFEAILKRMQSCDELEKQEQYQKESMKKRLKIIYEEIKRKEGKRDIRKIN